MEKIPYDYIPSYYLDVPELFAFLDNSPRTDYIVTLMIDGEMQNELLQWDWNDIWTWNNDWYEGQKDVTWVGIVAIDDVTTYVPETGDIKYEWRVK